MDELISICIPTYWGDKFLSGALDSILQQEHTNWEVIVVEDGTKDGTENIVKSFQKKTSQRVFYSRNSENLGLSATRNKAIQFSRGEFVALLDCDDLWTPGHLAGLLRRWKETNADLVFSWVVVQQDQPINNSSIKRPINADPTKWPTELYGYPGNFIQPSAVLMRKESFTPIGFFDESLRYCEDLELWLRGIHAKLQFVCNPTPTCIYRLHQTNMSHNKQLMRQHRILVFERYLQSPLIPYFPKMLKFCREVIKYAKEVNPENQQTAKQFIKTGLKHFPYRIDLALWYGRLSSSFPD